MGCEMVLDLLLRNYALSDLLALTGLHIDIRIILLDVLIIILRLRR